MHNWQDHKPLQNELNNVITYNSQSMEFAFLFEIRKSVQINICRMTFYWQSAKMNGNECRLEINHRKCYRHSFANLFQSDWLSLSALISYYCMAVCWCLLNFLQSYQMNYAAFYYRRALTSEFALISCWFILTMHRWMGGLETFKCVT